jgi:hypothetical protein
MLYQNGAGVAQDYAEAARWYQQAADQGNTMAQNNIGALYEHGLDVAQDYGEAEQWYRMAADQGYALAQTNIGVLYFHGWGVPQDYGEAMRWSQMAAAQGEPNAENIVRHTPTVVIQEADIDLRRDIPLIGGHPKPVHRLGEVLGSYCRPAVLYQFSDGQTGVRPGWWRRRQNGRHHLRRRERRSLRHTKRTGLIIEDKSVPRVVDCPGRQLGEEALAEQGVAFHASDARYHVPDDVVADPQFVEDKPVAFLFRSVRQDMRSSPDKIVHRDSLGAGQSQEYVGRD